MNSKKILIVDDLKPLRMIIKKHLVKIGFLPDNVIEGADGIEGVAAATKNPELCYIITDWNMPNMDGVSMIREIRSKEIIPSHIGIAVISGQDENDSVLEALSAGATDYIRKPISLNSLKEILRGTGVI